MIENGRQSFGIAGRLFMALAEMSQFNDREVSAKWPIRKSSVREQIRVYSTSILACVTEVFLQHWQRNQLFPLLVTELINEGVSA